MTNKQYTLHYFDSRGRANPIRMLLTYARVPFEDLGHKREAWAKLKPDSPLGQMPFLVEHRAGGDRVIPHSMSILRHLARTHGLDGKTEDARLAADVASETAVDARAAFTHFKFSPDWNDEAARVKYLHEKASVHFARFDKLLGTEEWFAGGAPTYADLLVFDTLAQHKEMSPNALEAHPRLSAFVRRAEAMPGMQAFLQTQRPA